MRLHEYYFDNLTSSPSALKSGRLHDAIGRYFGDLETWKLDFAATGNMRGIGWAIAYRDPKIGAARQRLGRRSQHQQSRRVRTHSRYGFVRNTPGYAITNRPTRRSTSMHSSQTSTGAPANRDLCNYSALLPSSSSRIGMPILHACKPWTTHSLRTSIISSIVAPRFRAASI